MADKEGRIRSAEGDTLFFDETGHLRMQMMMLRVIREKSVRPIGETRDPPVDVRILSATHRNLAKNGQGRSVPGGSVLPDPRESVSGCSWDGVETPRT